MPSTLVSYLLSIVFDIDDCYINRKMFLIYLINNLTLKLVKIVLTEV